MEVEPQPSYSWWLNSHNKPKKSVWLQTTLADLDNKTKAMLSLIQEEADSFAKRADMYYTKRPELINLIEQFYRAHRSLAERYDHLKGETKQNAHKAVKFQDALSCDGFLGSPFAKDLANENGVEGLQEVISVHDSSASDSEISEVDNPKPQVYKIKNEESYDQHSESVNALTSSDSELDNPEPQVYKIKNEENSDLDNESESALTSSDSEVDNPVHEAAETGNINSKLREMEGRISYLEEENTRLLRRLTMKNLKSKHLKEKIRRLKKEKNYFKEELFFVDREKSLLQSESDIVKAEYNKLINENEAGLQQRQVLTRKVGNLQKKNQRLSKQNKVMSIVLGFVNGQAASMAGSRLRNENEAASQQRQVLTSMVGNLQKENQRLSKQNNVMSIVLGFVNGQDASTARRNEMLRNEIQQGNQEVEAIIQNLKDEKRNAEIMFEAEGKLVSEQNVKIEELQSEVRMVGNLQKKNQGLSEQNKVMSIVLGFVNGQAASMARNIVMLRNEMQQGKQEAEATIQNLKDEKRNAEIMFEAEGKLISEQNAKIEELQSEVRMVGNIRKKIQRLSRQNKVMSIVLGFVDAQAASMARSNVMLRNEIQRGNQEAEAIIQSLKDEKRNAEIMFEAGGKLVSEQNAKIEELQNEVRILNEQSREQNIQLLERNEEKREAIRQLSFALDAQRDKNQRLEAALRNSRVAALCKVNTHDSAASQFSTWKKFLFAVRCGPRPQPHNHIPPGRCNFGSFYLNLCEKQTPKVLSVRE